MPEDTSLVILTDTPATQDAYRHYEVHQRERTNEATEKLKQTDLISEHFRKDPYPFLTTLREHYPCFRDWVSNRYWISGYNDVTSVFVDDASFESRSKLTTYGLEGYGHNLGNELAVLEAQATCIDQYAEALAHKLVDGLATASGDLAGEFAARYPLSLLCRTLDLPNDMENVFARTYWRIQRGVSWRPDLRADGKLAINQMTELLTPLVNQRRSRPGVDIISAAVDLSPKGGAITAADITVTLLEGDHETLHGALANLWALLLTHPTERQKVYSDPRHLELAYLETLRHSPPVLSADRFTKHEVERFGKLLPIGAKIVCSAAAANRDPSIFTNPESFVVGRRDLCQREPRGSYRADGLASGIALGLGKPSKHPAVPDDRPRSWYAITRDTAIAASAVILNRLQDLRLAPDATPYFTSLTLGEMRTCWRLPVNFKKTPE